MTTEAVGQRRREASPTLPPDPTGSEFEWLFRPNDAAFLVTHPSRWIDESNMPDNYRIIYLGRLNEILTSASPGINVSQIRISFIFNEDRVEVARKVYGESIREIIRDPVENMAREWQEFRNSGYIFLPTSIPRATEDPNSAGITGKFVAF